MSARFPEQPQIPSPEETLELTRELLARSRATLAEVSRRLAAAAGPEGVPDAEGPTPPEADDPAGVY